jgi:hypothetical protein
MRSGNEVAGSQYPRAFRRSLAVNGTILNDAMRDGYLEQLLIDGAQFDPYRLFLPARWRTTMNTSRSLPTALTPNGTIGECQSIRPF